MKKFNIILAALVIVMTATAAQAAVIKIGAGIGSDAATLETAWLGSVGNVVSDGFENLAPNQTDTGSGIALAIGTLYSDTAGIGHVGDSSTFMNTYDEHAVAGTQYWSNAGVNSSSVKGGYTLNINSGYNTIGFYGIDFHDVGGQVEITINTLTDSQTFNLFSEGSILNSTSTGTGVLASGTEAYFVIVSDEEITSIQFHQSGGDGYAIDGIAVATTPVPAAVWLLGSGLLGLVGFRRYRD